MNETKAAIDTARELNIVFKPTVTSLYKNQIHFLDCKQDSNRQLAHALHITWFIKLFPLLSFNRYIKGLHPLSFFEHQKTIMVFESNMGRFNLILVLSLSVSLCLFPDTISAQLRQNYYAQTCPNVEQIVRSAVQKKFQQTFVTVPATIRLFFHDCFVQGCDASVIIQSTGNNKAEKDHPDNLSLAGDGFDTVIKAKQAVDAIPSCRNKVSCADILAIATRDVIQLSGGPFYAVELGRLDGLSSTASSVNGKLPQPTFNLNQLNGLFAANGLDQTDMIALSAAHTVGFSHCSKFANRIYSFSSQNPMDPTLDKTYASQLQQMCPKNVDPRIAINMDPITPNGFDNQYFKNLQQGKGLFTSDQILFTDPRSKPIVNRWATSSTEFQKAFITAMTKMGRVGVKTGSNGNIRRDCSAFN